MFNDVGSVAYLSHWQSSFECIDLTEFNIKHLTRKELRRTELCCGSFYSPDPPLWDRLNESLLPDFIWTDVLALKTDLGSGYYCELLLSSSNFCVCIFIFAPTNLKPSGTTDSSSSTKINSKAHAETPESFCHNTAFNHSVIFFSSTALLKKNSTCLLGIVCAIKSASLRRTIVGSCRD